MLPAVRAQLLEEIGKLLHKSWAQRMRVVLASMHALLPADPDLDDPRCRQYATALQLATTEWACLPDEHKHHLLHDASDVLQLLSDLGEIRAEVQTNAAQRDNEAQD